MCGKWLVPIVVLSLCKFEKTHHRQSHSEHGNNYRESLRPGCSMARFGAPRCREKKFEQGDSCRPSSGLLWIRPNHPGVDAAGKGAIALPLRALTARLGKSVRYAAYQPVWVRMPYLIG